MTLHPFLTFSGNCREAMAFYQSCFGGSLSIRDLSGSGDLPARLKQLVLYARLDCGTFVLEASDLGQLSAASRGNVSLMITCERDRIMSLCAKLGGQSQRAGSFQAGQTVAVVDKYGVEWLLASR